SSAAAQVEAFASHWVARHGATPGSTPPRPKLLYEVRCPVRQMLRLALEGRVTVNRQRKPYPFETEAHGFLEYLRTERGLLERTIDQYLHHLNRFGSYLKCVGVTSLKELSPALLASFVVDSVPALARSSR